MVKVNCFKDADGCMNGYLITGHAGFAQSGQDIVCAAVSVLGINTANALETIAGIPVVTEMREGYLKVMLPSDLSAAKKHDALLLLNSLKLGLESIQESYGPQYLQLSTF